MFLTLKEFAPFISPDDMDANIPLVPPSQIPELAATFMAANRGRRIGHDIGYKYNSINGHMLGHGEPIRVKANERVLLHVLNASATMIRGISFSGHSFQVVALDGNPVPKPATVPVLWLGPAERISAVVQMDRPGVWVLGDVFDDERQQGMGIVVEYGGQSDKPEWRPTDPSFPWDYGRFAQPGATPAQVPDETIEMLFTMRRAARDGFSVFAINGTAFSMDKMEPLFRLVRGRRYRLHMRNATDDVHPIHREHPVKAAV